MNRDKAYRNAILTALADLTIEVEGQTVEVPVYDNKLETDSQLYVLIEAQTAIKDENFVLLAWRCTLEMSIYHIQQNSATFDLVDLVGEEIENRLLVKPGIAAIGAQPGWQIDGIYLASANSFKMSGYNGEAGTQVLKTLQFTSQTIKL